MLQGVRVVELATMAAAPSAVGLLADRGAQVVEIEPHAGDPMRAKPGSPPGSVNFDLHNPGERSIALEVLREPGFGDPDLARMQSNRTIPSAAQGPP